MAYNTSAHTSVYFFVLQLHLIRLLHTLSNITPSLCAFPFLCPHFIIAMSLSIGASGIHKPAVVYVRISSRLCMCASPAGVFVCVSGVASTAVVGL